MEKTLMLGLDIGTSGSKALLMDDLGNIVCHADIEHGVSSPHAGWAEHDAEKVWWADCVSLIKRLLSMPDVRAERIASVGISGIFPALLPVDATGRPLRPAILYSIDTRVTKELELLRQTQGDSYSIEISGCPFSAQSIYPKLLWLKNHEPEIFDGAKYFLGSTSYLVYRLTGSVVMDHGSAACGLPYDLDSGGWSEDACQRIDLPIEKLPPLAYAQRKAGVVTAKAAEETGLKIGTVVAVGTGDHQAEIFASGAMRPGRAVIAYGTMAGFDLSTKVRSRNPSLMVGRNCVDDSYGTGGSMSNGAGLTTWFRDEFAEKELACQRAGGENSYSLLAKRGEQIPAGSDGLLALPHFNGERCPFNDPLARGVIFGLRHEHTKYHIYRALLEGLAFGLRHIMDTMLGEGMAVAEAMAVGGGTQNRLWMQIVSDVTGVEQHILSGAFAAQRGAAFLGGMAAGIVERSMVDNQWHSCTETVRPNEENRETYERMYSVYRSLQEKTLDVMHELNRTWLK